MAVTVGYGFPRQPCSSLSGLKISPVTDNLAEGHHSVTQPSAQPRLAQASVSPPAKWAYRCWEEGQALRQL